MYEKTNIGLCLAALDLIKRGGTYEELDCQGFVEAALKEAGIDRRDYAGSNAMLRQMVGRVKSLDGEMRPGDIIFWVRHNGGESDRYQAGGDRYVAEFDGWNASHVGIYLGSGRIAESASSIGYWAVTELKKRGPTHYAKHKDLSYVEDSALRIPAKIQEVFTSPEESSASSVQANSNIAYVQYKDTEFQNLRAGADSKSAILAQMPTGSEIEILSRADTFGWVRVRYQGMEGYMSARAFKKAPPAGSQVAPAVSAELEQVSRETAALRDEIEALKLRLMEVENFAGMGVG